jgi:hypothetical protein
MKFIHKTIDPKAYSMARNPNRAGQKIAVPINRPRDLLAE